MREWQNRGEMRIEEWRIEIHLNGGMGNGDMKMETGE